ncbi:hypothetical protein [Roseimicrobium sp. ORNL1]|uniref:hypothetical protein n=1 Tax=Roseimicrobium sp. ORNL1 TaxID=2711231 RepID=UPI0013E1B565|nr:hypothetical protein [Roseimicrobium sp. ORNL1]QIF03706.1 hypothetical protein G5S37_20000 [Roseimicrobium sp. ORNL1]
MNKIIDAQVRGFLVAACVMGVFSMAIYTMLGEFFVAFVIAPLGAALFGIMGYAFIKILAWASKR